MSGYTATAVLSGLIGTTTSVAAGVLRGAARGLRVPARNALLADVVPSSAYGRAYGFGAHGQPRRDRGPLLALGLLVGVRTAMLLSIIPGALAAVAIVYAIRQARLPKVTERKRLRFRVRPVLRGQWGECWLGSPRVKRPGLFMTVHQSGVDRLTSAVTGEERTGEQVPVLRVRGGRLPAGRAGRWRCVGPARRPLRRGKAPPASRPVRTVGAC